MGENSRSVEHTSIWNALEKLKKSQDKAEYLRSTCKLLEVPNYHAIPFMLQSQTGEPFYTLGKMGSNCFVTIYFKVVKLERDTGCITLRLLEPNRSIWDEKHNLIHKGTMCVFDYLTEIDEVVIINPHHFSAIKCLDPSLVRVSSEE